MRLPIKIPKNHPLGFWIHPADSTGQGQPGVSQDHLEVPWECQIGPKLKIYVNITYCDHFLFLEKFCLLLIFHYITVVLEIIGIAVNIGIAELQSDSV